MEPSELVMVIQSDIIMARRITVVEVWRDDVILFSLPRRDVG